MDSQDRLQQVANAKQLLKFLGEDPNREGLELTPQRFVKSLSFLTSGYNADVESLIHGALFSVDYDDMVVVKDIEFFSLCEHHMLPFYGRCHVGYIPNGKVVGLSKIPRLVNMFARRLQVQERLTNQIAAALQTHLAPAGVGVVMEAYHLCMMMRGVEKQSSFTITSSMQGCFRSSATREEFMAHTRAPRP